MNTPTPSSHDDVPPPLRPSPQPFSKRAMIIASFVIGLPLLAVLVFRPSEDGAQVTSNEASAPTAEAQEPATEAQEPATEAQEPATEAQEPASARLSANVLPVPATPSYPKANRVGMLVLNSTVAGLGFADDAQNYDGALSCDPDDGGKPITIWYRVGKFPNERRLEAFNDHWTVNGIRVSHSLVLRVDGQSFNADDTQIQGYEYGAVKVRGTLPFNVALHAALQNAHYIELISGDSVLSIAPGEMRSDMIAIADKCARIAGSGKI